MTIVLHAPQIIYLALLLIGTGYVSAMHGKPKTDTHNIWTSMVHSALILGAALLGRILRLNPIRP
jgi:hypothetical protein